MDLLSRILILGCFVGVARANTYADRACEKGVDSVALDGNENVKFLVTFQCDSQRAKIKDCKPEGTVLGKTNNPNEKVFQQDGKTYIITCPATKQTTIFAIDYASGICHLTEAIVKIAKDDDSSQMTKVKFDCSEDQIRFKRCTLADKEEWVESTGSEKIVGEAGKKHKLQCFLSSPPRISYQFVKSACSAKDGKLPIKSSGPGKEQQSFKVKFECNKDQTEIAKCFPPGGPAEGIEAGQKGHFGGKASIALQLVCNKITPPDITVNGYVQVVCLSKEKTVPINLSGGLTITFECNDENTMFRKCFVKGGKEEGIKTWDIEHFGGEFGAKYRISCFPSNAPTVNENTFAVETCLGVEPDAPLSDTSQYVNSESKKEGGSSGKVSMSGFVKFMKKSTKVAPNPPKETRSRLVETKIKNADGSMATMKVAFECGKTGEKENPAKFLSCKLDEMPEAVEAGTGAIWDAAKKLTMHCNYNAKPCIGGTEQDCKE